MANIKVLDQNTINQIAAGEVIERPSSIVKELLENAIDAKASSITVEIKEGGISFIRITDNGCGIGKEDIPLAFLRHSTSKITNAIDLLTVSSLGFRGEALSSIAAVAMVELITKTEEALCGTRYIIEGGEEKSIEDIGVPNGTTFIVRNLFYNTPARRKFLKSPQTEAGYISDIVERIALSHPEISIRFICNNQNKLHTSGNGSLKDVIYSVFGRDITSNLIEVNKECDFMKITGFIGKPVICRGNRAYENYFINNRYIKSSFVSRAIEDAYKSFMMQHKYPFTCLNFEISPELLDVNVHPTKMELRFRNQEEIYPFTNKTIDDALRHKELIPEAVFDEKASKKKDELEKKQQAVVKIPEPFEKVRIAELNTAKNERVSEITRKIPKQEEEKVIPKKEDVREILIKQEDNKEIPKPEDNKVIPKPEDNKVIPKPEDNKEILKQEDNKELPKQKDITTTNIIKESSEPYQIELFDDKLLSKKSRVEHKIIGQLFNTYWIVEFDEKMFIIDQHAAHEKVLYERILKKYKESDCISQEINPPIIISLNMREKSILLRHMNIFNEFGYEIESFGGKEYAIRAVPYDLLSLSDKDLFISMLDSLTDDENAKLAPEMLSDRLATMACKAAIKGNNKISLQEIEKLVDELLTLDNPYNCPHGRPTIISMTKYEIEKKFKRII